MEEKGLRRGVPKVLVVLTDGRSQDEVTKVAKEMQTEGQLGCGLPHSPTHLAPFLSLHPQLLLYHFSHAFAHLPPPFLPPPFLPPPFLPPLLLHHIYTCISHSPALSSAFSLFSFSFKNTTPTSIFFPLLPHFKLLPLLLVHPGFIIFAIGFADADYGELVSIASSPSERHVFFVDDLDAFKMIEEKLVTFVCETATASG